MLSNFQRRDGEKISAQLKDFYFSNGYASIPEKSWSVSISSQAYSDSEGQVGQGFSKVIELIRDFAAERAAHRWSEAFEKHMSVLIAIVKVL